METKDTIHQSLEARLDDLDRQMAHIADNASRTSQDAKTRLEPQLDAARLRLAEARTRLREKQEADDRASDAELAQLGRDINDLQAGLAAHQE